MRRMFKLAFVFALAWALAFSALVPVSDSATLYQTIQLRRGLAVDWTNVNPVLRSGEPGYETDTGKMKIGDGTSHWNDITYLNDTMTVRTAAQWTALNPLLRSGEPGYESDTSRLKIGDGALNWASLPYLNRLPSELRFIGDYSDSLATALASIGSTPTVLIVNSAVTISTATVVPSTIDLRIVKGGSITKAASATLTINGNFEGTDGCFSGFSSGNITFGSGTIKEALPEWWAANTTPGTTDMGAAIQSAIDTLVPVKFRSTKYLSKQQLDLKGNHLLGSGWSYAGSNSTELIFSDIAGAAPAIVTTIATAVSSRVAKIKDAYIYAADWTSITGHGLDIEAPIMMENVTVAHFKKSNMLLHHNAAGSAGPYESRFTNCNFLYAGEHGVHVATGANCLTFINCQFKWNGAPSRATTPVAGNYDGLLVDQDTISGAYAAYGPDDLRIIGGDASYNSRYGWNFSQLNASSAVTPGYAEGNLHTSYQVRVGDCTGVFIRFGAVSGGKSKIYHNNNYGRPDSLSTAIFLGGEYLGTGEDPATNIAYPFGGNIWSIYLSSSSDFANYVALGPDSTTGNLAIGAAGTARILITGLPTYADNAAALVGGLTAGMLYRTATGVLMIVFTP